MFLSMKYSDDYDKLSQIYRNHLKLQCVEETYDHQFLKISLNFYGID